MRTIVFWTHLVTGVAVALVVLLMSVTGVVLTYQRQLTELANRDYRSDAAARGARPLDVEALLATVRAQDPDFQPSSLTLKPDPAEPAVLGQGRRGRLYVDRYTGQVLGDGSGKTSAFLQTMMEWHRWLGRGGEHRELGKAITGACNLAFLFLVLSGIYLWWPRNWSPRAVRNVVWFRGGLQGKARDFNWHNVIGLWSWIPLVVVVASGVVISYGWAGDLVYRVVGEQPARRGGGGPGGHGPGEGAPGPREASAEEVQAPGEGRRVDELIAIAGADTPDWQSLTVSLSGPTPGPVRISIDRSPGGQPARRLDLEIDPVSGDVVARRGHGDLTPGQRLRGWLRFAHTGEVYGFVGQTIAGLASAGAAFLVWTGLALSWRRFFGSRRAPSAS